MTPHDSYNGHPHCHMLSICETLSIIQIFELPRDNQTQGRNNRHQAGSYLSTISSLLQGTTSLLRILCRNVPSGTSRAVEVPTRNWSRTRQKTRRNFFESNMSPFLTYMYELILNVKRYNYTFNKRKVSTKVYLVCNSPIQPVVHPNESIPD